MRKAAASIIAIALLLAGAPGLAIEPHTSVDKWRSAPPAERRKMVEQLSGKAYGNLPEADRQRNLQRTEECIQGFAERGKLGDMPIEKLTDACVKLVRPKVVTEER